MTTATLASPRYSSPIRTAEGELLPSRGAAICDWIEAHLVYGEGAWYGRPVRLREWQRRFIYRLYEYYPDGRRRYRRALLGVGKGNGKTPLAAWISAAELLGPFAPISPHIITGAASLRQADLVFGDVRSACRGDLLPFVEIYDLRILRKGSPGLIERIAAEAGTNDGARATAFVADELHEWTGRTERVYLVVDGAVAKRENSFTLAISTAGVEGESLLRRLYDHGRRVASGETVDDAFLFEWYEAPEECDLENPDEWEMAVRAANPAAGDFLSIDSLRHRWETIPRWEFARYHLNRWTSALQRWLPIEDWDACSGEPEIPEGSTVWVGVDGAAKRDTTAVYIVRRDDDGILHTVGRVFEPPEGEVIDPELVENHIRDLCRRYDVRAVCFDPALFYRSAQLLLEEGYPMVEIPQTVPRKMAFAQALYDAVIGRSLRHGGDPVLRVHADAVVAKDRGNGWTMERLRASRPIDAVIALAMAVQMASEETAEPQIAVLDVG